MTAVDRKGVAADDNHDDRRRADGNHDNRRRADGSGAGGRTPDLVAQSVASLTALRTLLSTLRARMAADDD